MTQEWDTVLSNFKIFWDKEPLEKSLKSSARII